MRLTRYPEVLVVGWGFVLSGLWETLQTPLYADAGRGLAYLVKTRLHCTAGDALILLSALLLTSLVFRTRSWLAGPDALPFVVFLVLGLCYTAASEWFNTRVALSWEYAPAMPRLLGIGLAPLAQWLVVPLVVAAAARRSLKRGAPR